MNAIVFLIHSDAVLLLTREKTKDYPKEAGADKIGEWEQTTDEG